MRFLEFHAHPQKTTMGVKGLYSYLRSYRHPIDLGAEPKAIGVDGLSILYKFRGDSAAIVKALEPFTTQGYKFLFVFDGKPPETKMEEVEARKEKRAAALLHATALKQFLDSEDSRDVLDARSRAQLERKIQGIHTGEAWHVSRDNRRACKHSLWTAGIPCIKAKGEADDLLFALWRESKIQAIVSTDMDFLVAGVSQVWIPSPHGPWEEILLEDVLRGEDVTFKGFQDAAILCGMDTGSAQVRLQPQRAFSFMRHYGSLEILEARQPQLWDFEGCREYVASLRCRFTQATPSTELVAEKHAELLLL